MGGTELACMCVKFMRMCRCWRQKRGRAGVWDTDTQVHRTALRVPACWASTNHSVWSWRNGKDFPCSSTSRISRTAVSCFSFLQFNSCIIATHSTMQQYRFAWSRFYAYCSASRTRRKQYSIVLEKASSLKIENIYVKRNVPVPCKLVQCVVGNEWNIVVMFYS